MSVVLDTFKKRPGATQCYNCNYFNHSSVNCFIKPRCLKCSKEHRTGECPIKERLKHPIVSIVTLTATRQTGVAARPSQKLKLKKEKQPKIGINSPRKPSLQKRQMRTFRTQMPLPTAYRWQHLPRKTSRRRIAILSPIRIRKRKTPHPKDSYRQWPSFANFFRTFQASLMQGRPLKMRNLAKIVLTSFSVS
ncbi:hypothetical protein TNCV_3676431 [Trichonephila clavipes]|nr:hypothetical protein TNCV_3676431 [Trichonephila clavipes]